MLCEYSLFSFCTLFPVAVVSYIAWNYEYVAKLLAYDSDLGIVKFGREEVQVNTSMGRLRLPHLTLPSYDWTVGFFTDDVADVREAAPRAPDPSGGQIVPCSSPSLSRETQSAEIVQLWKYIEMLFLGKQACPVDLDKHFRGISVQ